MLFLEHHLEQLSRSVHANPRYLKNAIRAALRDKYRIEAGESFVDGRPVKTWRVLIAPFIDDPNKARMNGLEGLVYTLAVSEEVPGQVDRAHRQGDPSGWRRGARGNARL